MHVHNTSYVSIDSDQVNYSISSNNSTSIVIYIPENVRISSDAGNYALTIPHYPNAHYIEVCVDGIISGNGGSDGGGIKNNSNVQVFVTTKNKTGTVRGGTSNDSLSRNALDGNFNIQKSPRIFNF